jgi:hypothetical protein
MLDRKRLLAGTFADHPPRDATVTILTCGHLQCSGSPPVRIAFPLRWLLKFRAVFVQGYRLFRSAAQRNTEAGRSAAVLVQGRTICEDEAG